MIGHLRGRLLRSSPERVVLDVGGVGYAVRVPLSTYWELEKRAPRAEVELLIHTHVREDAIELFGFSTEQERLLFEKLISVSGIGPRLGQGILSGMAAEDLLACLASGDVGRLVRIPGVGKKTAERLILELRDSARSLAGAAAEQPLRATPEEDLVAALLNLGYRRNEVERAAAAAVTDDPEGELADLLRATLKRLSKV